MHCVATRVLLPIHIVEGGIYALEGRHRCDGTCHHEAENELTTAHRCRRAILALRAGEVERRARVAV